MSDNFKRTVRPGTIADYNGRAMSIFATIKYKDGRLSITGVEGPLSNGDARGGCGQIDSHLREPGALDTFSPADGWTLESFRDFLAVWDRWHLNDMRACDAEMRAAGWHELARREIFKHEFTLTSESYAAKRAAEEVAKEYLRAGQTFTPSAAQVQAATLPYSVDFYSYERDNVDPPEFYERATTGYGKDKRTKAPERKTLGWVRPNEHADGLLTRKLRPDGPGYGSAWFREEVPADVLAGLQALPVADKAMPAPWGR